MTNTKYDFFFLNFENVRIKMMNKMEKIKKKFLFG